jgi:iron complex transport system permease protein
MLALLCNGPTGSSSFSHAFSGVLAVLGLGDPLPGAQQVIVELRLWRTVTTAGVGAALGLSGALVQGLFRNGLAAPSVLGVTGGASLGATVAILLLGGYGPALMSLRDAGAATIIVPLFGFVGALGAVVLVTVLATPGGRLSVPTLLLTGIAVNTLVAGVLSLVSSLLLDDWEVARSILAWTFGTLDDRTTWHAITVWAGLAVAVVSVPFVARELDMLQSGEEDAASLGVSIGRVRIVCLAAAALAAASAVAVAGQIAFVGLLVPHLVRQTSTPRHTALLPLSVLGGAVFLVSIELLNVWALGQDALQPGVVMSLVGGPVFVMLLLWNRREVDAW